METNKSKVDLCMLSNSRTEFVLVSSSVIILNKKYLERLQNDHLESYPKEK